MMAVPPLTAGAGIPRLEAPRPDRFASFDESPTIAKNQQVLTSGELSLAPVAGGGTRTHAAHLRLALSSARGVLGSLDAKGDS